MDRDKVDATSGKLCGSSCNLPSNLEAHSVLKLMVSFVLVGLMLGRTLVKQVLMAYTY